MKKGIKLLLFFLVIIVILIILAVCNKYKILYNIKDINSNTRKQQEEKIECTIYDKTCWPYRVLVKINGKKEIDRIEYNDGLIVYCNNRTTIDRDMQLELLENYEVSIIYKDGEKSKKNIYIDIDQEFDYVGKEQIYCVSTEGYYKLQAYGGSGGIGYGQVNPAGNGGFTEGTVYLKKGQYIYIHVGAQGDEQATIMSYNGGGASGGNTEHRGGQGRRGNGF